jgi:hypothetical protein
MGNEINKCTSSEEDNDDHDTLQDADMAVDTIP